MPNLENVQKPLQQRVNEILQFGNGAEVNDDSELNAATELERELRLAEADLQEVQQRIARLRGLLANIQPD